MASSDEQKADTRTRRQQTPLRARILGFGSLVPLAALVALAVLDGGGALEAEEAETAIVTYALMLVVFQSGVRSGHAIGSFGIAPVALAGLAALIASVALLFAPAAVALGVTALGLAAQGAHDVWSSERGRLPPWFGRLRIQTASLAVLLTVAALLVVEGS